MLVQIQPPLTAINPQVSERTCLKHGYDTANYFRLVVDELVALNLRP